MNDVEITENAVAHAKAIKKQVAKEIVDHRPKEDEPVSVFMAGSPGAGKTETARNFIKNFSGSHQVDVVHIDNDELRKVFNDYNGINSAQFQTPATILVEAIHDRVLKKKVSFLLDSTLSNFEKAKQNIDRSLNKNRYVLIIFVYQSPIQAWQLVKAREIVEGRRVPADVFVKQFLASQAVINQLKKYYREKIDIVFLEKNIDGTKEAAHQSINDIDDITNKKYDQASLEEIVGINLPD